MDIVIQPGRLSGVVTIPASKSAAHRAILCAAFADGVSTLGPVQPIKDILVTLECARALGAEQELHDRTITVKGGRPLPAAADFYCGASASTLRFLIPIAAALGLPARFYGEGLLPSRPIAPLLDELTKHGAAVGEKGDAILNLGGRLRPGRYEVAGNISSQFITGLLLALPLLSGDSEIALTSPLESKGYVDMTLATLAQFGVEIFPTAQGFSVPGGQHFRPRDCIMEGDYSGAAFWLCAGALGSDVAVSGLLAGSRQGDRAIEDLLARMGADVSRTDDTVRVRGGTLHGFDIDVAQIPDLLPILAATAAFADGVTTLSGAARLRIKECDRLAAMTTGLQALGATVDEYPDKLVITGSATLPGGCTVDSCDDHRIAMAMSIAALRCEQPVTVTNAACVDKSYPHFYEDLRALGGLCHVI